MTTRKVRRCATATMVVAALSATLLATDGGSASAESKAPSNPASLQTTCKLWFNYTPGQKMDDAPGHFIVVTAQSGTTVNYRYNWDGKYAVVGTWGSDGIWGFMNRNCLGTPKHKVGGRISEHLPSGVHTHTRWMCGQDTLYVRDSKQRVIGRLYRGDRFIQYGPAHKMQKDQGKIAVGLAYGHVNKAGRVYEKYLSDKPC